MLLHPNISPVALSIGPLQIHWYGLMYVAAVVAAYWLGRWRAQRGDLIQASAVGDLLLYLALAAIIGGRLGFVLFYQPLHYLQHPLEIPQLWRGGMSFHGGLAGVTLGIIWYARKHSIPLLALADFLAPLVPPGLLFGRLGNFINQELIGRPSSLPWAMWFPALPDVPRHPSQLYEAALEGALLFLILWLYSSRPRPAGRVTGLFLISYGILRALAEIWREPEIQFLIGGLPISMGQLLCLPMLLAGAWLYCIGRQNRVE